MKYYLECTLQVSMYFLIKMELIMVFECLLFVISALHTGVVQSCITCKQLTKELRLQSEEPRWAPKFLPTWDNFFYHSNASLFLFLEFSWYTMSVQCTDSANLHVDMVFFYHSNNNGFENPPQINCQEDRISFLYYWFCWQSLKKSFFL